MRATLGYCLVLTAFASGCASKAPTPADTGAREAVQAYYEAIAQRDWTRVYGFLHPESQERCSAAEFQRLGQAYHRQLGFAPETVQVRFCDEQNDEARARVVLRGSVSSSRQRYQDGVWLRRREIGWGVVMPPNFGRAQMSP